MTKRPAHHGPMSRLPDEDAYWETLTDRLVTDAVGRLQAYRSTGSPWWRGIAHYSTPLSLGAAAAVIASVRWLPGVASGAAAPTAPAALYGLVPSDPLAALFMLSAEAPSVATLMATPTVERPR